MLERLFADRARRRLASINFRSGLGDSAWILYALARSMKPESCVEIGSSRGRSACHVGLALRENGRGKLWAIDPHRPTDWNDDASVDTYGILTRNLGRLGLRDFVEVVREDSVAAASSWARPIDLLFIDGDHSYDGVKRDWEAFVPFVSPFGVVVFHDTLWDLRPDPRYARPDMGVPRFVEELRRQGYPVLTIDKDYGVSLVQPRLQGQPLGPAAGGSER
jgi:predicted O-methyltransferase YrrM